MKDNRCARKVHCNLELGHFPENLLVNVCQSSTRILDPRNSRINQLGFFSLDHEKKNREGKGVTYVEKERAEKSKEM